MRQQNLWITLLPLVTAAALSGCSMQSPGDLRVSGPTHTLGVRLNSYGKHQHLAYAHLESLGIRNVEIPVPAEDEVEATRERLAEHGLRAIMLTGRADLSKLRVVDELAPQLRICRDMGVRFLFLSAKTNGAERKVVCQRLWQAGEFARSQGVTIVLETHPDLMTNGAMARETLRQIQHPNVRMNYDTGNLYYYNHDVDAVGELEKVIEYVATVHLKDTDGEFQSWNFPALGQGVVDFKGVLARLDASGFRGPFIIELEGRKGVELDEQQTLQYVADSVAYLRTLARFR